VPRDPVASFFLCFNAAFINVITLNGYFGLATSHVTGLVAKTSMALGKGDWGTVYLPATAWLAFLGGSFLAGVLISYESFYLGRFVSMVVWGRVRSGGPSLSAQK
jgi:uncharacterized membrane protein YoaK (UPF0700 family)